MTKLACAVCGEVVFADSDQVVLDAEWKPPEKRGQRYYVHPSCMTELNDPEDFSRGDCD